MKWTAAIVLMLLVSALLLWYKKAKVSKGSGIVSNGFAADLVKWVLEGKDSLVPCDRNKLYAIGWLDKNNETPLSAVYVRDGCRQLACGATFDKNKGVIHPSDMRAFNACYYAKWEKERTGRDIADFDPVQKLFYENIRSTDIDFERWIREVPRYYGMAGASGGEVSLKCYENCK